MSFNTRSPAVKRLMREAEELLSPTELFYAQPLEDNLFEWHFTIRGPSDTDFDGGIYHGRILLPAEYPMKPPSIIMLTHNGRFKVHEKICLSISGYHPETWLPSWSIRTALLALIGFMPTLGEGAIGSLDYTAEERKSLASKSVTYHCSVCKTSNNDLLPTLTQDSLSIAAEARELGAQINFKNNEKTTKADVNEKKDAQASEGQNLHKRVIKKPEESSLTSSTAEQYSENNSQLNETDTNMLSTSNIERTISVRNETNPCLVLLLVVLGASLAFLILRRIYLITESYNFI